MVKAFPVNDKGERIGSDRNLSDTHWARLKHVSGGKLRWVCVESTHAKPVELIATATPASKDKKTKSK